MRESEQLIREYFTRHGGDWAAGSPLHDVAQQLASGGLDPNERSNLARVAAFAEAPGFRAMELAVMIAFVRDAIEAGVPKDGLSHAMLLLKRNFRVREGEFFRHCPNELAQLIGDRLDAILEDGLVNSSEDLEQVELQRFFDLSYDDYLALGRPAFERAVTDLEYGISSGGTESTEARKAKLALLYPLYRLATSSPRTPGALY